MRPALLRRLRPACLLLAGAASAETTISTTTTANVATSTAAAGAPDDVTVSSTGQINPAAGTAITLDSNNKVNNAGTLYYHVVDNSVGITTSGAIAGSIVNSGTIRDDDDYAATDSNADGIVDGAFAQGTGRYGILLSGGGFTGTINNSGTIAIEGNNSFGLFAGAPIAGSVVNTGTISTLGDGDTTIRLGPVSGGVTLDGTISAQGQGSAAVALTGDIGGGVVIHGGITATGYSSNTLPTSTSTLLPSNLLQGGSAVTVGGNVAGGLLVGAALTSTTDTSADTDADGVADVNEGAGAISGFGAAPALLIGSSSQAVTLGVVSGAGAGLVVNGTVAGTGVYAGVSATAVQIGGLGQATTLTGGMTVAGTVTGRANAATAIAILVDSGASVPAFTNSGTISAALTSSGVGAAQAIAAAAGASLPTIANSGTISASATAAGSPATAILDRSGTLASVTNSGTISATNLDGTARAIDVSAGSGAFSYSQSLASSTAAAPSLVGAIFTGSGLATIAASAGTIKSALSLGNGNALIALSGTAAFTGSATGGSGDDALTLADTASYTGTIDFGGGNNRLAVGAGATFSGQILNGNNRVALSVASGGTASFTSTSAVQLSSLTLGGTLGVVLDPNAGTGTTVQVAGVSTIASGAALKVSLASLSLTPATYTVLRSGTLSGGANLALSIPTLPYLLTGSLAASDAAGTVAVTVGPKTGAALGLRRAEAPAFPAIYTAIAGSATLSPLFLGLTDADSTLRRVRQMLPDYEGGIFDVLSQTARILAPGSNPVTLGNGGPVSVWAQQAFTAGTQHADATPGYRDHGYGVVVGGDVGLGGFGRAGLSLGYTNAEVHNSVSNDTNADAFQAGAHWIAHWGGLQLAANGAAGHVKLNTRRDLSGTSAAATSLLTSSDRWHGLLLSGNAAASYEVRLGAVYLRPAGTLTYARLHEQAHDGSGGGTAFDLLVDPRTSRELAVNGTLAVGLQFGDRTDVDATLIRLEAEGGRREILSGNPGTTTARFAGGNTFTLTPEGRTNGYLGTVRATIGSQRLAVSANASGETRDGYHALVLRLGVRGAF